MFCRDCGAQVQEGAKFCEACGAQMAVGARADRPEGRRSSARWLPLFVLVVLLGVAAASIYVVRQRSPRGAPSGEVQLSGLSPGVSGGALSEPLANQVRRTRALSDIKTMETAIDIYMAHNGFPPSQEQGLGALISKPSGSPEPMNWQGPYLKSESLPKDPWGTDYVYTVTGEDSYKIVSYGSDKQPGGTGDGEDVTIYVASRDALVAIGEEKAPTVKAPDLIGMSETGARKQVEAVGLVYRELGRRASEDVAPGSVLSQEPTPGRRVPRGEVIKVVISEGTDQVVVPNVSEMALSTAELHLKQGKLTIGRKRGKYDDCVPKGYVCATYPAAGAKVVKGIAVDLEVSLGPKPMLTPNPPGQSGP